MIHRFKQFTIRVVVCATLVWSLKSEIPQDPAHAQWQREFKSRQNWWSFQPVQPPALPQVNSTPISMKDGNELDLFILDQFKKQFPDTPVAELVSKSAEPSSWLRRLYYVTVGLPPDFETTQKFLSELGSVAECDQDKVYSAWIDRLLDSQHFGERWARHWMDWVRYAESHGSEGDPNIPHAWRYRDYLIRALNQDVPYFQMVREHIAGDLLENPRLNEELEVNESAIGAAHYRFVLHGFAPTDALDEQVRFTEDQIDAVTKAFQGLTVACARCHNHKFDAIEQTDFYALYGVMVSSRPALITIDSPERKARHRSELLEIKSQMKNIIGEHWLQSLENLDERLAALDAGENPKILDRADNPFSPWLHFKSQESSSGLWDSLKTRWHESQARVESRFGSNQMNPSDWYLHGVGFEDQDNQVSPAGAWTVSETDDQLIGEIFPRALITHSLSSKRNGIAGSSRFEISDSKSRISVRTAGSGSASARYVVQNYPRNGTVYPVANIDGGQWRWIRWNVDYWKGDQAHLEWTTAADQPVLARTNQERSWFAITDVFLNSSDAPNPEDEWAEWVAPLFASAEISGAPSSLCDFEELYHSTIKTCIEHWLADSLSNEEARFLSACVNYGILPNKMSNLPDSLADFKNQYQSIEAKLPIPIRSPGTLDGDRVAQPFFPRGDHKRPGDPVPQGFLAALNNTPYNSEIPARLQLAEDMANPENPFTTRVIVNRLWSYCFGQGLVSTPDNFGQLGEKPSHPELLDFLATKLVDEGGSIKETLKLILNSKAFRLSSEPTELAAQVDPDGHFYTHYKMRRLEAEALRDSLLQISGAMDSSFYGPSVSGTSPRRSVYVRVQRNNLDPFLNVFNAPPPSRAQGKRDSTNIPSQSLTLMNDPWVRDRASMLAASINSDTKTDAAAPGEWIRSLYQRALGRNPSSTELERAVEFLNDLRVVTRNRTQERREALSALQQAQKAIDRFETNLRDQWIKSHGEEKPIAKGPEARAFWDFSKGLTDSKGAIEWTLANGAELKDGAIVLNSNSAYAHTGPLPFALSAKTLEVQVQLADLKQQGGGALTIQTLDGNRFDSIVFAEQSPAEWLAGSDGFSRTQPFRGAQEKTADKEPVTITIVYTADGGIQGFRNGEPYGDSYKSNGPLALNAGESQALIGLRHGAPSGNRLLKGKVFRAALYDRALSHEEVKQSALRGSNWISLEQILATSPSDTSSHWEELKNRVSLLQAHVDSLEDPGIELSDPEDFAKTELAHALLQMKEWIYLR